LNLDKFIIVVLFKGAMFKNTVPIHEKAQVKVSASLLRFLDGTVNPAILEYLVLQ
jgi:hypothetical protein